MTLFFRCLICISGLSAALLLPGSTAPARPLASPLPSQKSWNARGEEIVRIVRDNFYDAAKGREWAQGQKGYAAKATSEAEFITVTERALAELHASHTAYYTRQHPRYYDIRSAFGYILKGGHMQRDSAGAEFTDDHFVRVIFAGGAAEAAGLHRGDRILGVDGKPFHPVSSFRGKANKAIRLKVERFAGKNPLDIVLIPRLVYSDNEWAKAQQFGSYIVRRNGKSIIYVPYFCGIGPHYQLVLEDTLRVCADADALVLDFRNGWGSGSPEDMINLFSDVPPVVKIVDRNGKRQNTDKQWRKPVVILINGGTNSGKEVLLHSLKRAKRATLVGETTAGAVLGSKWFDLSDGSLLELAVNDITVDGERLEGKGIRPDIPIADTLPYANGADPQWEKAIEIAAGKRD